MPQRLHRFDVLREASQGARSLDWFRGKVPSPENLDREQATRDLVRIGFIESVAGYPDAAPHPFRLTQQGRAFLESAQQQIGRPEGTGLEWNRVDEVAFPDESAPVR